LGRKIRAKGDGAMKSVRSDPAEDILRERCARGEIDAEEYERTLEVLRSRREEV